MCFFFFGPIDFSKSCLSFATLTLQITHPTIVRTMTTASETLKPIINDVEYNSDLGDCVHPLGIFPTLKSSG